MNIVANDGVREGLLSVNQSIGHLWLSGRFLRKSELAAAPPHLGFHPPLVLQESLCRYVPGRKSGWNSEGRRCRSGRLVRGKEWSVGKEYFFPPRVAFPPQKKKNFKRFTVLYCKQSGAWTFETWQNLGTVCIIPSPTPNCGDSSPCHHRYLRPWISGTFYGSNSFLEAQPTSSVKALKEAIQSVEQSVYFIFFLNCHCQTCANNNTVNYTLLLT